MRFGWPEYLGCLWFIHDTFMKEVADSTIEKLRSMRLVRKELQDGVLLAPQGCLTAPAEFRDTTSKLLITEGDYAQQIISNAYSYDSARILLELGVAPFKILHFVKLLDQYISKHMAVFSSQTTAWHSRVARLLCEHFSDRRYQPYSPEYEVLKALRIIPLDDGSWALWCFMQEQPRLFGSTAPTSPSPLASTFASSRNRLPMITTANSSTDC